MKKRMQSDFRRTNCVKLSSKRDLIRFVSNFITREYERNLCPDLGHFEDSLRRVRKFKRKFQKNLKLQLADKKRTNLWIKPGSELLKKSFEQAGIKHDPRDVFNPVVSYHLILTNFQVRRHID